MNITINGDIYITNYGQPINEIAGDYEDLDLPFDFLTDDEEEYCNCCVDDCEECEFYEDEDDEVVGVDEIVDELTSIYAEILSEEICCPDCLKSILIDYTKDLINSL